MFIMRKRIALSRRFKTISLTLAMSLLLASPVFASESTLPEVRNLLQNGYVDPVSSEVLQSSTIGEMLQKLGDPHTLFFTAKQYQDFINSMDMTFSGIGVYIELVPEGIQITSLIKDSPAEKAGLKEGDIITQADGQALAGLPQDTATGLLRGPDGSTVQITVKRGEATLNLQVSRQAIEIPTVDGKLLKEGIGYIGIHTFGATTPVSFNQTVAQLKAEGAKAWIIDLRDNPGGYLTSALSLAGYFIGDQTALQTKDRSGKTVLYSGEKQSILLTEPTMFLTNENSASASEILTSVVKDYHKATIVGNRTYGKGSVQSMFPLSDGSVLKMTIAKFFSPYGHEINKVGINPDIKILKADSEKAAELLLDSELQPASSSSIELSRAFANGKFWSISLEQARTPEFWQAYGELASTLSPYDLQKEVGQGWLNFGENERAKGWPLYYPNYHELNSLQGVPLDKKFTVSFNVPINWQTVSDKNIELIDSVSGERVPLEFKPLNDKALQVIPGNLLEAGKSYWLITHPSIQDPKGRSLQEGALSVVQTVPVQGTDETSSAKVKVQALQSMKQRGIPDFRPVLPLADYGQALIK